jgi:hypothetical protein
MVAFSRFAMAIGVATMALKTLERTIKRFNDINMKYGSAGQGGNLSSLELQSMAMALRELGVDTGKEELTKNLSNADYIASSREFGYNMFPEHAMAGINTGDVTDARKYLARAYASYLAGVEKNKIKRSLLQDGYEADKILASFDVAKNEKGISSAEQFYNYLSATRAGVSGKGNISNLGKSGIFNRAVDTASGGFGQSMQEHPLQTLAFPIQTYLRNFFEGAMGLGSGSINYNKTVTIHTNSSAVAREAIGEDLDPRIMQMNGGGH